ncbi:MULTISPECIES: hypothetical protein [Salinibaculum]|uniref:hypothetical protein n=1 Tax=Salinibaculum TaxID=2732368 RepID=UPI0030D5C122
MLDLLLTIYARPISLRLGATALVAVVVLSLLLGQHVPLSYVETESTATMDSGDGFLAISLANSTSN